MVVDLVTDMDNAIRAVLVLDRFEELYCVFVLKWCMSIGYYKYSLVSQVSPVYCALRQEYPCLSSSSMNCWIPSLAPC